ncbi:BOS1-like vesicular transport protein [Nosema bombycis CQ1]|uniref:BOS1-like vesicular transport protein n=1 Tax=Nosema bombycis (strain CQ1 / CVCC 102059) TaxID=578461 RepID=R0MB05_NOSB1|nr:BOS1-like vesicular transport protein [Nosema bombycis CQ1]|eukprot:EOB11220.1 BOS1-like vesicular transport protein [Nosema bombycis CQ1]
MKNCDLSKNGSSSFSFINFDWGEKVNSDPEDLIYPTILDPNLRNYYIGVSVCFKDFMTKMTPTFTYRFIEDYKINIVAYSSNKCALEIDIVNFEMVEFKTYKDKGLTIVTNRSKFKKNNRTKINKEYKKKVLKGETVKDLENKYEEIMKKIFQIQIEHNHNFLFIDAHEDLNRNLKNLIKSMDSESVFVPKIKNYKSSDREEHFEEILTKIPGISKCVAKAISSKYKIMINFYSKLVDEKIINLENLIIWDEVNCKGRALGRVQAEKLMKIFLATDKNTSCN